MAGGEISSGIVDVYPEIIERKKVNVNFKNIDRLIGKHIDHKTIKKTLKLLDIIILNENGDDMTLEIPPYRVDVQYEADIIEEILRIYGYNNVEIGNHVNSTLFYTEKPDREKLVNIISDMLTANGFSEIMCNSLNPASFYETEDFNTDQLVLLANPLSSDLNAMRQSLLYGGLTSIARNINRQNSDLRFYEFGYCYFLRKKDKSIPEVADFEEKKSLDLFLSGNSGPQRWNNKPEPTGFFHIKSYVEMILSRLGIDSGSFSSGKSKKKYFHESITWSSHNTAIAEFGSVSKEYLSKFDIDQDVYYAYIDWDTLLKMIIDHKVSYTGLPKYPWVRRDLALLIDKRITFEQLKKIAFRTEKKILREVDLFDVYESESLGRDKKSYAMSFILRDDLKTLTDKNIDKIMNNLINAFEKEAGAKIR